ncbi:hypothetical protein FHS43_004558 [Streptosporangium becharense]|uniref:Uncharacterized protein n=1 Tax=Streptosporangium becharense TaxID=1816182 RepID=A0A7W9IK51_9ACTN|nr:hypothetical protein [Streptosporangium becharense]MBB2913260.1 hypothetical protein [Streptosporangium becharense]MBB5822243.1 hypothetical protein [Streptosporangium becharense]
MAEPMVPNPWHERLRHLLVEAENRSHEVRQAYQRAFGAMRAGQVWTGPTAVAWAAELEERHHRLARLAQRVVDAIEEELHRHPPLVTETEANAARREMAGRM